MNYAGILSPLGGLVKRIKALQNKLKPERYVQQNTDNDGGNRARSRHVCGLGQAYLYVVSDVETASLGNRARRPSLPYLIAFSVEIGQLQDLSTIFILMGY